MNVYNIYHTEDHELILPVYEADFEFTTFDCRSLAQKWKPIRVRRVKDTRRKRKMVPGDFPSGGIGDLALSGTAKEKIGVVLEQYGELLPLACDDGEFWTLNVMCVLDALDMEKSDIVWSSEQGRALMIHKYAFRRNALQNSMIFKVPEARRGPPLVTTPFVDLIQSSGLTGLVFKQIWAPN